MSDNSIGRTLQSLDEDGNDSPAEIQTQEPYQQFEVPWNLLAIQASKFLEI
jgi:hypothetical protein